MTNTTGKGNGKSAMLVGCGYKDLLSVLEFIFIATFHKHRAFTITYVRFGNLSPFANYAMTMRPKKAKTAVRGC